MLQSPAPLVINTLFARIPLKPYQFINQLSIVKMNIFLFNLTSRLILTQSAVNCCHPPWCPSFTDNMSP